MPTSAGRPEFRDVIKISNRGDGFAYRDNQVLVQGLAGARRLVQRTRASVRTVPHSNRDEFDQIDIAAITRDDFRERLHDEQVPEWYIAKGIDRPLQVIDQLRAERVAAQPNHVFVAHSCGSPCPPHPALAQLLLDGALVANPLKANPLKANPLKANPLKANPLKANFLTNTAVPAAAPTFPMRADLATNSLRIVVLDTGLPGEDPMATATLDHRPDSVRDNVTGDLDLPDDEIDLGGPTPYPRDEYLDPVAGHGGFIAGIIDSLAPGCAIEVKKVIGPLGDVDETTVAAVLAAITDETTAGTPTLVTMSFGGTTLDKPGLLRSRIVDAQDAGVVFVASAGNDGVCTPQYPAAFDGVVAVGALGPSGPAEWSNYGDWVDACAPGTDLVSWFFTDFNGKFPTVNSQDVDRFDGWATWSGTSFAAPVVAAKIATEFATGLDDGGNQIDLTTAVERVIDAPYQTRIPCLGTVVTI